MFSNKNSNNLDLLKEAFDQYSKLYCEKLPDNVELDHITFPDNFEYNMQKLIARQKKPYYYWFNTISKKVAIIILIVFLSMTTITFSVKAIRDPFVNFIVETFERFTNISFENQKNDNDSMIELVEIYPKYIPENYVLVSETKDAFGIQLMYANKNDETLTIMYMQTIRDQSVLQADTEGVPYEQLIINGKSALFYSNKGINTIILGSDNYIFTLSSPIDKEELIKIMSSIETESH